MSSLYSDRYKNYFTPIIVSKLFLFSLIFLFIAMLTLVVFGISGVFKEITDYAEVAKTITFIAKCVVMVVAVILIIGTLFCDFAAAKFFIILALLLSVAAGVVPIFIKDNKIVDLIFNERIFYGALFFAMFVIYYFQCDEIYLYKGALFVFLIILFAVFAIANTICYVYDIIGFIKGAEEPIKNVVTTASQITVYASAIIYVPLCFIINIKHISD